MATIEILSWKENFTGYSVWDNHARSELTKRLRRGIKASPAEIKRLARQIHAHQLVSLHLVYDEAVYPLTQILEATGAEIHVSLENTDTARLLKNFPDR